MATKKSAAPAVAASSGADTNSLLHVDLSDPDSARKLLERTALDVHSNRLKAAAGATIVKAVVASMKVAEVKLARRLADLERRLDESAPSTKKRRS
jgi:hypothetical protein